MNKIKLLLVEDNEGDIVLTQDAIESSHFIHNMDVARNGAEAIQYFEENLRKDPKRLPDLVLLDINLPKKNGIEVLKFIKNNDATKHVPVIILTTSSSNQDIMEAYRHHANCYITKPMELDEFNHMIHQLEQFWFQIIKLPNAKTGLPC